MTLATILLDARRATTSDGSRPATSKHTSPADSPGDCGVRSRTPGIWASCRLQARRETADPRLDALAADPLVERERLGKRPAVLEGVEPARREGRPVGDAARRAARDPRAVARAVEGRDRRSHQLAHALVRPQHARPARPVEPLVAARDERVAAEVTHGLGPSAEAVHAVDAQEHALRERLRDRPHGQPDSGARVDPREGDDPRPSRDRPLDAAHDLVLRCAPRVVVEPYTPDAHAGEPERLVRRVEVVLGRHDLVVRAEREPRVEEPESHRRRVGERDLGRRRAQEAARRPRAPRRSARRRDRAGTRRGSRRAVAGERRSRRAPAAGAWRAGRTSGGSGSDRARTAIGPSPSRGDRAPPRRPPVRAPSASAPAVRPARARRPRRESSDTLRG